MKMRYGYKASAERFAPRQLLDFSIAAEQKGFDSVVVSDHFQPWQHADGHADALPRPVLVARAADAAGAVPLMETERLTLSTAPSINTRWRSHIRAGEEIHVGRLSHRV